MEYPHISMRPKKFYWSLNKGKRKNHQDIATMLSLIFITSFFLYFPLNPSFN